MSNEKQENRFFEVFEGVFDKRQQGKVKQEKAKEAYIKQDYDYGDICEFDWGGC